MNTDKQKGFAGIELILLLGVVLLAGAVVWYVVAVRGVGGNQAALTSGSGGQDYVDCGTIESDAIVSSTFGQGAERTNDCFEQAFVNCTKATFTVKAATSDVVTQYSIDDKGQGEDTCKGGYSYTEHMSEALVGDYIRCELDQSTTPFLAALGSAMSGLQTEVAERCEGPLL